MLRAARYLTVLVYLYSLLLGVVAFTYDVDTGYVCKKTTLTIYCLFINLLTLAGVVAFARNMEIKMQKSGQPDLHYKLLVTMTIIRITGVLMVLAVNWLRRNDFVNNLNLLQEFRARYLRKIRNHEKHLDFFNQQIVLKFLIGGLSEMVMFFGTIQIMHQIFEVNNPVILTILGLMSTVLNLMSSHYFFIVLNLQILFRIMIDELKSLLRTMEELFRRHYRNRIGQGLFSILCCQLSDDLDYLARNHSELQLLGDKINRMFYIQGCCVFLVLYLNNICIFHISTKRFYMLYHWLFCFTMPIRLC
ncbi:putative gustatory receptor 59c [Musca autumnalis]|uniref:putative gustatory receptor 59c n=1 Tax=Musca autumnalis TaxID=221902 RepID=UPI003CF2E619